MPAICPARVVNVATHAWTKLYTETMSLISGVCECPLSMAYLKQPRQSVTVHIKFVPLVSGLLLSVEAQIRIKLPHMLQLQLSSLQVADAAL